MQAASATAARSAINTTNAGFVSKAYGIDVGENLGGSALDVRGCLSNGGTISVTMNGNGIDGDGVVVNVETLSRQRHECGWREYQRERIRLDGQRLYRGARYLERDGQ